MFSFISNMAIKTVEQTMNISQDNETISLLNPRDIIRYRGKFKHMHIGLVQVAFKHLTLLGTNTSIQVILNDSRCLDWKQFIMGAVETSLCYGLIYFNVYPNLTLSLTDRHIGQACNLKILTTGYNFLLGLKTIAILYRIYYKVMNTLTPNIKNISYPSGLQH